MGAPALIIINLKQIKMALEFKKYVREDRKEFGTIAKIGGKDAIVKPSSLRNWTDESKRIVLVIERPDETSVTVTCSEQVTARLRSKEMRLSQVLGLTVVEQKTKDGQLAHTVVMPNSSAAMPGVTIGDSVEKFTPVSAVNIEDLIAF